MFIVTSSHIPLPGGAPRKAGASALTGTPLATADLQIASIALAHNLILITGNVRHFERVPGLIVENWLVE